MEKKFYEFRIFYDGIYEICRYSGEKRRSVAEAIVEYFESINQCAIVTMCVTFMEVRVTMN